ncbi:MAG: YraN family protein [Hyphomicrobium sp.]
MTLRPPPSRERQNRYRSGHTAEYVAAAYLMARGHRVLMRRFKTGAGEIDLVTLKGGRIGFVEVKRRATLAECEASITPKLRQRVRAAANLWMAKHPRYQASDCGFDLVFILPWRLPVHLKDAL